MLLSLQMYRLVVLATCRVPAAMDAASVRGGSVMATTTAVITATSRTAMVRHTNRCFFLLRFCSFA